jgi:YD repeat-containing protein
VLHGTVTYDDLTFHGSLDEIDGDLDIDAGAGSNTLAVSDHADPDADTGFVIDDHSITGLADGAMTYTATGGDLAGQGAWTRLHDAGMFGRGITIHLGTGSDSGTIDSVRGGAIASSPFGATVTTVYANQGADDITVDAPVVAALLVVHGDAGDDIIDAGTSSLPVVVFGDAGSDTITGGSGNDQLFGDDARVHYVKPAAAAGFDVVFGGDPDGSLLPAALDAVFLTPDLLLTRDTTIGAGDTIDAGLGNDIVLGGRGSDTVHGDGGNDLILGDFGRVATRIAGGFVDATSLPLSQEVDSHPFEWLSTDSTNTADAAGDVLHGDQGEDVVLGQQGGDTIYGGTEDDDLTGGHNVVGGLDAGDRIDGGAGDDVVLGDNGTILRTGSTESVRFQELLNGTIAGGVTGGSRPNPAGVEARQISVFDHPGAPGTSGDDYIAGGPDNDVIFGQIGNDTIQGDGDIDIVNAPSPCAGVGTGVGACRTGIDLPVNASRDRASDGDDYIEGNGGSDAIFGNLGQDDIIGGSSHRFGLDLATERPDGEDLIFGGSGTRTALDDPGDMSTTGHARDADVILGDNGAIYRLIDPDGQFLQFNYDTYGTLKVIPRAVVLLDYSPTGDLQYISTNPNDQAVSTVTAGANTNVGAGDFLHGEAGDDIIHGQTGSDRIWGEGQSDDLYGESGYDWISGGTGVDGILGDDGRLLTSRNGTAEPLYGIAATTQTTLTLNGDQQDTVINVTGLLNKQADVEPFYIGHNDVAYGGLGNDFMHGGAGDDALSGAEALPFYYVGDPLALLAQYYEPGNVLQHGFRDPEELRYFDENDPWRKVMVPVAGGGTIEFLLNFRARLTPSNPAAVVDDGRDVLFGDVGHDWLVGGTNRDVLFGGYGDDLLQADDDLDTTFGTADPLANDRPDPRTATTGPPSFGDITFGGAGRDVQIANTITDRMYDLREFDSFFVPFSAFGNPTVNRSLPPGAESYLYTLSRALGADRTRGGIAARNGEPFGEIGLVTNADADWGDQTAAPSDPQPGTRPGQRDTGSTAEFGVGTDADNGSVPVALVATHAAPYPASAEPLAAEVVTAAFESAREVWTRTGLDTSGLDGVMVVVVDLPGATLAEADGTVIRLDVDAAGWGWATAAAPGAGRIDLVTVLAHELGHILGLTHDDADVWAIMAPVLAPGPAPPPATALLGPGCPIGSTVGAFARAKRCRAVTERRRGAHQRPRFGGVGGGLR